MTLRASRREADRDFNAVLLAMAGHDLRQPLQAILSSYSWLAEHHAGEDGRARIERGWLAIAQLTEQLDHLVQAVRIHERETRIVTERIRVQAVFDTLGRDNAGAATRNGVGLRIAPTSAIVMSDAVLLDSILGNLLHNAIKYTPRAGRVLLCCRRRGGDVRIEVHDTGVGIAPDQLSRVFGAFHRVDSTRPDGLGLGLFVAKRAADLLDHRLQVQSRIDIGTCFSVVAPSAARKPG